jgi:hypothetical protein
VPVALGADQLHPAVALEFLFKADSLLDLVHFQLNNLVLLISIRVTVGQHLQCLLILTPVDQEAG